MSKLSIHSSEKRGANQHFKCLLQFLNKRQKRATNITPINIKHITKENDRYHILL